MDNISKLAEIPTNNSQENNVDDDFIKSLEFDLEEPSQKPQNKGEIQTKHINFSRKLREMKEKLEVISDMRSDKEILSIADQINSKGGIIFLESVKELNSNFKTIIENQNKLLEELSKPVELKSEIINKSEAFGNLEKEKRMQDEINGLKKDINDFIGSRKTAKGTDSYKALEENIDSLKNSIFMINKKIDISNPDQRITKIENKMKELIYYLHQLDNELCKDHKILKKK